MSNEAAVIQGVLVVLLGAMMTAFFTLLWRRLDSIEKILNILQADLKQFYGDSHRVK